MRSESDFAPSPAGEQIVLVCQHGCDSAPKYRLHSQLCGTALRATYALAGSECCLISPQDASARVSVTAKSFGAFNDRGQILAGAHVTDTIRSDLICVNDVDRSILRTRASPAASTATVT